MATHVGPDRPQIDIELDKSAPQDAVDPGSKVKFTLTFGHDLPDRYDVYLRWHR